MLRPVILLVVSEEPKIGLHPLIISFRLPIGSRVIRRRDILLYPQGATELLDEPRGKLQISIAYDFVGESVSLDYSFEEHACGFFCHDGLIAWYEVCHLGTALVHDGEYGVVPVRRG